jgi:uncharacterized protein YeaO (DUF488 family)
MIRLKRVYEEPSSEDGFRILVERLWPRGISKGKAYIQLWLKEIAPSTELRKWYSHDVTKWKEFKKRYEQEIKGNSTLLKELESQAKKETITLVYAARDEKHNSALVLKEYIERKK